MLTVSGSIFSATLEQVETMAKIAGLRRYIDVDLPFESYGMWQDRQTGGGACRLVWRPSDLAQSWGEWPIKPLPKTQEGIVWVSRHSGYAYADITEEVCDLFVEMGCEGAKGHYPHI